MGFVRDLTGKTAANRAGQAGEIQAEAAGEASALLDPFANIAQTGIDNTSFLTDPTQQFDFLQSNPLFNFALDRGAQAQEDLLKSAAARGRLSSDDTIQGIQDTAFQNAIFAAQPLVQQQASNIGSLIDLGQTTAGAQGNLLTGQASALAGGLVGEANARQSAAQNQLNLAAQLGGFLFSDPKLKTNIRKTGEKAGFNWYQWDWNEKAAQIGLFGSDTGVMADEVLEKNPEAVDISDGYMRVNYTMLGV